MAYSPDTKMGSAAEIGQHFAREILSLRRIPDYQQKDSDSRTVSARKRNDQIRMASLMVTAVQQDLRKATLSEGQKVEIVIEVNGQEKFIYPIEEDLSKKQRITLANEGDDVAEITPKDFDSEARIVSLQSTSDEENQDEDPSTIKDPINSIASYLIEHLSNITKIEVRLIQRKA